MASLRSLNAVLVVGPTGTIGKALCQMLISRKSEFNRIAFFDDVSRPQTEEKKALFTSFLHGGMEQTSGTYTDTNAFYGFDCVVMPLGNHAMKYQPIIIDTAIKAGRYYRDKVLTREHLEQRGKADDTPDLGWTYIQLGRLTEYSVIKHFGIDNANYRANIYGTPAGRQSLLSTPDAIAFTVETIKHPFSTNENGNRRSFRFHGSSPTWIDIFSELEAVTGHRYEVNYHLVKEALERETRAKTLGDVDLELEASHQLIQGRGGTLLPEPFDNNLFPNVHPESVHTVFQRIFEDPQMRSFLGLS